MEEETYCRKIFKSRVVLKITQTLFKWIRDTRKEWA